MKAYGAIANDLDVHAKLLERGHTFDPALQDTAKSMRRGADAIRELIKIRDDLEAAAEAEALKLEAYQNGDDLHG